MQSIWIIVVIVKEALLHAEKLSATFNWVLFQFSRIKKFITYTIPDVMERLVVITTLCSQSIKSSKKLEPLWKYGSYLVIFLRNCFYSSCVKIVIRK